MPKIKYNTHRKRWDELEKYSKDGVYLDGILKSNMDYLKKSLYKDYDFFIVIDGRERFGKSTLAAQLAYYLDPTYNLDRCCFTADQFVDAVAKAQKYQAIVFDEAHGYLGSRQTMSSFNKKLVKVMSEMGSRNLIVIIVLPNFFELDKYPAIHRSSCLINVHKRGLFKFFSYNKKKDLYLKGKRFYAYNVTADFHGRFGKWFPLDKEEYQAKKDKSVIEDEKINNREKRWLNQRNHIIAHAYENELINMEQLKKFVPNITERQLFGIISKVKDEMNLPAPHSIIRNKGSHNPQN